jgi:hypothetical protein
MARFGRPVLAIAVGTLLAAFATVVSVAGFARARNPQLAKSLASFDADAAGERGYDLIQQYGAKGASDAVLLASQALSRSPLSVSAARTLGYAKSLEGDKGGARKAMLYAESLSRRDLPTQMWLIEDRVAANDVPGALRHYDRALSSSALAAPALFPTLSTAVDDPEFTAPIARVLATAPPWRTVFLAQLVDEAKHLDGAARLISALNDRSMAQRIVMQTVAVNRHDLAVAMLKRFAPSQLEGISRIRERKALVPFDWQSVEANGARSIVLDGAIEFDNDGGHAVNFAKRLVAFQRPKTVRIDWRSDVQAPLTLVATCGKDGRLLARAEAAQSPLRLIVAPTRDCPTQWLLIGTPTSGADRLTGTITRLSAE